MMCKNCVHYEICCNEGRDDEALTFCADFFEVVRCKDCKYFYNSVSICNLPSGISYATPNSFCSYGERKETDEMD